VRFGGWRLALLVALGLGVHLWFVAAASALDTDQALVLLMARAFAQGHPSVYFWSQNYMAALEPLLLAPLAWAGVGSPTSAALVALGLTALLAGMSVAMSGQLGGRPWVVLLMWAVPPAVVVHHHVALYGARLAATVLMVLAFWRGMRPASPHAWMAIGSLSGAAYFGDHLMLPWAAGVAWLALAQRQLGRFALGALPLVAVDTVLAMATPAAHLAGPTRVESWLATGPHLVTVVIPQLLGLLPANGPGPIFEPAGTVVPAPWPGVLFTIPGGLALTGILLTLARRGRALGADERVQALLLVGAAQLALFLFVGGDGERWSVRYLVPLWPAVTIGASLAVARWSPRRQPLALLLVAPALHTLLMTGGWPPRGADGARAKAEASAVAAALREGPGEVVWADYWDAYRLAVLVGGTRRWVPLSVIDRRPDWRPVAERPVPVAYLVRRTDGRLRRETLQRAAAAGIAVSSQREVGRFLLITTARPIPALGSIGPAPARSWQRLAALSAGLLFAGMLLAVAVLRRGLRPDVGARPPPATG
jgi:hypothetical protein